MQDADENSGARGSRLRAPRRRRSRRSSTAEGEVPPTYSAAFGCSSPADRARTLRLGCTMSLVRRVGAGITVTRTYFPFCITPGCSTPRWAGVGRGSEARAARRGGGKSSHNFLKTNHGARDCAALGRFGRRVRRHALRHSTPRPRSQSCGAHDRALPTHFRPPEPAPRRHIFPARERTGRPCRRPRAGVRAACRARAAFRGG